jgi:hypothetical protein
MPRPWSCWTTPTRSRRPPEAALAVAAASLAAAFLAGCSPGAPPGVDRDALDAAISKAVGDPNTCVLIAEAGSGKRYYRYNSATTCAKEFAACDQPGTRKLDALLDAVAKDRQPRQLSCNTEADASRGVGWAAGPIAGTSLVYAAMMEGDRAFPGRMMADRLDGAFRRAKVSK